jgi:hypothetical protein
MCLVVEEEWKTPVLSYRIVKCEAGRKDKELLYII